MKWGQKVTLSLLFVLVITLLSLAEERPSVIPYQGQLADQEGKPVSPAEAITLVFRIYLVPTGGRPIWQEAHANVSVVGGRFSVLLGAHNPFNESARFKSARFKKTLYLGVTVDDGDPVTADVEMRPRQAIVPAFAAFHATKADHAEEAAYAQKAGVSRRAIGADSEIPVGGITIYFGLERELPENWKICNGQRVNDPKSRFDGKLLPDLQGLFVRGAASEFAVGSMEGVDTIPVLGRPSAQTNNGGIEIWGAADNSFKDNRPRHMALHYIIRIR